MNDVKKHQIAVVGTGAIGGLAGAYLSQAGYEVILTDKWEEHVEAMRAKGLHTDGVRGTRHFDVQACLTTELASPLDILLIAVKSHDTVAAMGSISHLLTPETIIVSLQNGFNVETLQDFVPASQILGTVPNYGGALVDPGHIEFVHEGPFHIGELDGAVTPRIQWLVQAFKNLTTTYVSGNIVGEIWGKQCYFSQITLTAVVDTSVHRVLDIERYRRLGIILVGEALEVAWAAGVDIPASASFVPEMYQPRTYEDTQRVLDYLDNYLNGLSRHQVRDSHDYVKIASGVWWDIVYRHRPSETPGLTGAVVEKAKELSVPVPLNQRLVEMIYEIERGERPMGWENLDELDDYRRELGLELP
jgi:2-dehydropantoate 2-reductase